jgi:hypothetical protein
MIIIQADSHKRKMLDPFTGSDTVLLGPTIDSMQTIEGATTSCRNFFASFLFHFSSGSGREAVEATNGQFGLHIDLSSSLPTES